MTIPTATFSPFRTLPGDAIAREALVANRAADFYLKCSLIIATLMFTPALPVFLPNLITKISFFFFTYKYNKYLAIKIALLALPILTLSCFVGLARASGILITTSITLFSISFFISVWAKIEESFLLHKSLNLNNTLLPDLIIEQRERNRCNPLLEANQALVDYVFQLNKNLDEKKSRLQETTDFHEILKTIVAEGIEFCEKISRFMKNSDSQDEIVSNIAANHLSSDLVWKCFQETSSGDFKNIITIIGPESVVKIPECFFGKTLEVREIDLRDKPEASSRTLLNVFKIQSGVEAKIKIKEIFDLLSLADTLKLSDASRFLVGLIDKITNIEHLEIFGIPFLEEVMKVDMEEEKKIKIEQALLNLKMMNAGS